jgi:pimeloyl-ACP methyl ester carboxylesterase
MKKLLIISLVLALVLGLAPTSLLADSGTTQVERFEFPVTLAGQQTYTLVGYLYTRQGNPQETEQCGRRSNTLQVLLHGATYNHKYWDPGEDGLISGAPYSYARFMVEQCYSVLALDRLGAGESSRPDGDFVNLANEAESVAQVLTSLRTKQNPTGRRFKRIVVVGHSFGSLLAVYTLGEYGNVADALVATGWLHAPGVVPLDPAFVEYLLSAPYVPIPNEARNAFIFHMPATDPAVVAWDNATIYEPQARGYQRDGLAVFAARAANDVAQIKALTRVDQIAVPIFAQLADFDLLFPSALAGPEATFYSSAPSVTVDLLTNMGHGFNLHLNHLEGWQHIESWITANVVNR